MADRAATGTGISLDDRQLVQIYARSGSTTEVKITDAAPSGGASDYVSSGGEGPVRLRCSAGSSYYRSANVLHITIADRCAAGRPPEAKGPFDGPFVWAPRMASLASAML